MRGFHPYFNNSHPPKIQGLSPTSIKIGSVENVGYPNWVLIGLKYSECDYKDNGGYKLIKIFHKSVNNFQCIEKLGHIFKLL